MRTGRAGYRRQCNSGSAAKTCRSTLAGATTVHFSLAGLEVFGGDMEMPILDLAEEIGIEIPSSCRAGTCGTCRAMKIKGEVECDETSGLSDADREAGYILTCMSRAKNLRGDRGIMFAKAPERRMVSVRHVSFHCLDSADRFTLLGSRNPRADRSPTAAPRLRSAIKKCGVQGVSCSNKSPMQWARACSGR
jgi:ferredoxin